MVWSRIKTKAFPLALTKRMYIWTVLVLIVSNTILTIGSFNTIVTYEGRSSEDKLFEAVEQLNRELVVASYDIDKLIEQGSGDKRTNLDKLNMANTVLKPVVTKTAVQYPGLEMGYYFNEIDGLINLTSNSEQVLTNYLRSVQPENKSLQYTENIINLHNTRVHILTYPLMRNGQFVGQVWAYFREKDTVSNAIPKASKIFFAGLVLSCMVMLVQWLLFTRLRRELENFAAAILEESEFPEGILPELSPVVQRVKSRAQELRSVNEELRREVLERKEVDSRYRTLASMVESTNDAVIGCQNGIIISWNKSAERMYGYTEKEVLGKHIALITHPEVMDDMDLVTQKLNSGESMEHHQTLGIRKDGTAIDVSISISPILDNEGNSIGTSTIARDITEHKKMERDMSRLDRLNLVGQMAAGIGHEIRNPMTTVRGFLQLLGEKQDLTAYRDYFEMMISELDRANAIITEYLSMARNKAIDLKLRDLNHTIKAISPLIEASTMLSNKAVELQLGIIPLIMFSEKEIRQVILNLARNGLEAMGEEGTLTIQTYLDGDEVVLAVKDQGQGIEPSVLEKIGTPFFTTKDKGTGLGLAVCYSIVSRHHAALNVETGKGGTTFFVRFKTKAHLGTLSPEKQALG